MTTGPVDARAARSRESIMRALADVVAEHGVSEFSVQEVADRARVAHRTVYRHYGSREELLDGYARWLDERLIASGGIASAAEAASIPEATEVNFRLLDGLGKLGEALVVASIGTRSRLARRDERTEEFRRVLEQDGVLSHLPDEDADVVLVLIRTLASSNTWFQFRHQHDVDAHRAGRAVAWAIETLLEALSAGRGPRPAGHRGEEEDGT